MDYIDKQLVQLLCKNARTPLKTLAETVGLSSPAVSTRIARLENTGLSTGYSARISLPAAGCPIKAYVSLEILPEQKPEVLDFIRGCANVLECDCVTGAYSLIIKTAFPHTEDLDRFIGDLQHFGRTQTQIVFANYLPPREAPVSD